MGMGWYRQVTVKDTQEVHQQFTHPVLEQAKMVRNPLWTPASGQTLRRFIFPFTRSHIPS